MATIRLIPSTYYLSNSSYLSVSNASNMYNNTDNTIYATVTNSQTGTSSYYIYLRGFNFDDVPSNAVVNSITILVKGYESGLSTSTSYAPRLYNGTSSISTASAASQTFSTSTRTITVPYTGDWETLKGYGSNLGIRCTVRRSSRNTTGYLYLQGAEIEIDYTIPVSATVTSTLSGDGTISPSGAYSCYEGDEYVLTITPTNTSDTVTATQDGTDITSSLVAHGAETDTSAVLGTYTLVSGGFNGSGASWFSGIVGNGYDTSSATTSNYYSSSSSTNAVFQYAVPFSIPSTATVTNLYMMANGHAESTSNSSEYMCVQLKSGSTTFTEQYNFKSAGTSNTTVTIEATTLPTPTQLESLVVECTLGYYGGAINGVTVFLEYETGSGVTHYTYTYTVNGNSTIAVVIGSSAQPVLYVKQNGSWVQVSEAYRKVNGVWVLQSDLTTLFSSGNFIQG